METRYLFGLPFITLICHDSKIEALLDTGFNGALLLPKKIIEHLDLQKVGAAKYAMADGAFAAADVFTAEISWFRDSRTINVISSESDISLIGMELLHNIETRLCPIMDVLTLEPVK